MRIAKGNAPFVVVEMAQALVSTRKVAEIKRILGRQHVITAIRASGRKGARLLAEKLAAL